MKKCYVATTYNHPKFNDKKACHDMWQYGTNYRHVHIYMCIQWACTGYQKGRLRASPKPKVTRYSNNTLLNVRGGDKFHNHIASNLLFPSTPPPPPPVSMHHPLTFVFFNYYQGSILFWTAAFLTLCAANIRFKRKAADQLLLNILLYIILCTHMESGCSTATN